MDITISPTAKATTLNVTIGHNVVTLTMDDIARYVACDPLETILRNIFLHLFLAGIATTNPGTIVAGLAGTTFKARGAM